MEESGGFHLSFEKILLFSVILFIWISVVVLEKLMPHQSAAILVLGLIVMYGVMITLAHWHHRRKIHKNGPVLPFDPDYQPLVSVVVPAHNEALVIADTIENLMALDYPRFELWVFDDRSTDGTADVLAQLARQYPDRFRYEVRPESSMPGKSAVLNDALMRTRGDIIAVFDADARVQPDFLKRTVPVLSDPGVGALQVRKVIMNASTNLLTRCQHHEYIMDAHIQMGRDIIKGAVELRGNGQLVKRSALQSINGWTEDTITDDLDLSTKLHLAGWDVRFLNDVAVQEEGIVRFKPLLRQRRRWAEGSLKRYLEYSVNMFTSPDVSYRAQVDMLAYFIKFLFPIWVTFDLLFQLFNLFFGEWPNHLISSLIMFPALAVFMISGLFAAIYHQEKKGIFRTFIWSIETGLYMLLVWVPVVMWIIAKILVAKDQGPLNWGKTEHLGTQAYLKPSRLDRIKSILQRKA